MTKVNLLKTLKGKDKYIKKKALNINWLVDLDSQTHTHAHTYTLPSQPFSRPPCSQHNFQTSSMF